MAMATTLLVARLVAAAFVGSSGGFGNGSSGGDGDDSSSDECRGKGKGAMALAVAMALLVERPMAVARV